MKLFIERKDGQLYVQQVVNQNLRSRLDPYRIMRTLKTVKDTPANFANILRWANAVGHDVEEL